MAEVDPTASTASPAAGTRTGSGFELRLERGGAHVRLGAPATIAGLLVEHLDLKVPEIALPFDAGSGPAQFRNRLCDLDALTVLAGPGAVSAAAARLDLGELGLVELEVALRDGFAEVGGRLAGGAHFSLRLGLLPGFDRGVAVVPYAPRIYGPSPLPAAALPHLAARALAALGLPDDPLPLLVRRLLVSRGWKVPRDAGVRLTAAAVAPGGVRLAWAREAQAPPTAAADADLLAAVEGARAFAEAEALAAAGDWSGAREIWLASAAPTTHAFAADRLLSLLCIDERFHDEALDLAAGWLQRRPDFAPALAAEAWVRAARGEHLKAAQALVALAEGAVSTGERLAAVAAAEAALALPGLDRELITRAVDAALAAKRDHLPALRALRSLAQARGDKGGQIRAARRVLAYAPSDLEKARAHAELGELLLESDPPGARLHLDRALRLAPDDADSLSALARACAAAGEHLRAVGALDRLAALKRKSGDLPGAVALALEAGAVWESRLGHVENALLRYREAAELGPRAAEAHRLAASCAERLGRWTDAADHHAAALAVLDRTTPEAGSLAAAHHRARADVAERHLADPAGAATHLEAALATGPLEAPELTRLASLHRRLGRSAELLATLDRLAPLTAEPEARAVLLAEAGALALGPLGRPDLATDRFADAARLDGTCRPAIEGLALLALGRGDGAAERDALLKLVPLARDRAEEASVLDRLAAACERAGDLSAAVRALAAARRAEPSRQRLAAASALARRSGDHPVLAALLAEQAQAALAAGDRSAATAAWRERAELLSETAPELALTALDEARALHPADPALPRLEALLAERVGDHHRALGALRALLSAGPTQPGPLELRAARAALAAGEQSAALAHAERALAAGEHEASDVLVAAVEQGGDPAGHVDALLLAGRVFEAASLAERLGDRAGAVRALERAAEGRETAGEALRQLLRIHAAAGDTAAAASTLLSAARRAGGREGAELAWRAFSLTGGDTALATAAGADPTFAPARAERAVRRAATDTAGALADAESALSGQGLDPARRLAMFRLSADLAERSGDGELARRRLAAFCQAGEPADADLVRLAALQRATNDLDGLAGTLARRAAIAPEAERLALWLELAAVRSSLHREPEAVAAWRAARQVDPAGLGPLRALLHPARAALLQDGEREALLRALAGAEAVPAGERAEAWDGLAEAHQAAGDEPGVREARDAAARLRGDDDEGLERRAQQAATAGDHRLAAQLLQQRAHRALAAGEAGAAERLAEAGLLLVEAGETADGEAALRQALGLDPEPERARAALTALAGLATGRGDTAAEALLLAALVPLVPTSERPDRLLRLAALRTSAGDAAGALEAAEQARTLAPRTLAAVRQARLAAAAMGDERAVTVRLEEEARLDEAEAGALLLARARLLVRLGDHQDADAAFTESIGLLPPDQGLAVEQARLRRGHLPARHASEPMERFAGRLEDPAAAARAQAAAAALAWEAGDGAAALRCARRAFGRSRQTPALAGPMLARLLYLQGSFAEALVVHRTLLELGFPGFDEGEVVTLCRQLAELAAEAHDPQLTLAALDRLLTLRPQESGAALDRFHVDPDRRRAVTALGVVAGQVRSHATRVELLATAAEAALAELHDLRLGDRLFREVRAEARLTPGLAARLERRRAEATRAGQLGPEALLGALHDSAELAVADGDGAAARELLEEALDEQLRRGMRPGAVRDLLELERLLSAEGATGAAAARAAEAAGLLDELGDATALAVLRRALERDPSLQGGPERLRALEAKYQPSGAVRARLLLGQARLQRDAAIRAGLRREAGHLLAATGDPADQALAADALLAVTADLHDDEVALREAADALVGCGRGPEALPLLASLLRAHPEDGSLAELLERAGGPARRRLIDPVAESIEQALAGLELSVEPPASAQDFAEIVGPRTLEFPAPARPAREPAPLEPPLPELEAEARVRAAEWLASARMAAMAGASIEELRLTIGQACEADPDSSEPWAALAALELRLGDPIAAARASLAVSIRTEGEAAADAALVAARLFLEQGRSSEASRALRAATLSRPASVPPELTRAVEALASDWPEAAAGLVAQLVPEELGEQARGVLDQLKHLAGAGGASSETPPLAPADGLDDAELEAAFGSVLSLSADPLHLDDSAWTGAHPAPPPIPLEPVPVPVTVASAEPATEVELELEPRSPRPGLEAAPLEALESARAAPPEVTHQPATEVELEQEPEDDAPPRRVDPILLHLRGESAAAAGPERASLLERLAGLLERQGETGAAADSLIEALTADPARELTWGWLDSLVVDDPARAARVTELRLGTSTAPPPVPPPAPSPASGLEPATGVSPGLQPSNRPAESLERPLTAARQDPADVDALLEVAERASRLAATASPFDHDRLVELARLALSIAAFVAPDRARAPGAPPLASELSQAARDRVALPAAVGPLGRLLSLLAPHLEPLFPADLARRGVTAANRVVAPQAPAVREPFELAAVQLSARDYATFLVDRPGALIGIENTRPPALIVPAGFELLPLGPRRFLATRALDQLERGWALVGKFAPRDVGILLELACRFAGGNPPPLGLPAARASAFLSAMARGVPPVVAARASSIGPAAATELIGLELGELAPLLQRTGSRVALLATGDPGSALAALLAAEPPAHPLSGAEALQLPALRELATLALSEAFLDLRVAVVG